VTSRPAYQRLRSTAGRLRDRLAGPHSDERDPEPLGHDLLGDSTGNQTEPPGAIGHAPDVELEPTNLGPVMDEAVLRAKRRMRVGADPDYDLIYENFDVLHYLLQSPKLIDDPDVDLIRHFLDRGRPEKLSPHPDFSMTEYLRRYPQKLAPAKVGNPFLFWLKSGRRAGDITEPTPGLERIAPVLGLSPEELTDSMAQRRRDLQERFRTGKLGEMLARAAEIEPLIGATWTEIADPHLIPLSRQGVVDETAALYEAQQAADFRPARVVLVIDRPHSHGGRRMEGHLAHALADRVGADELVAIYTDDGGESWANRFPAGVREIDFAAMVKGVPRDRAQRALAMLLRSFHAEAVVNVESQMFYRAMRMYGHALAVSERLFLCFLGKEQTAMGSWTGSSLNYAYRTFEHATGVLTDSSSLADELIDTYRLPDKDRERLHVLRAPVDVGLPVVAESPAREGRRPQVFWAGRWGRHKRVDLALEIAQLMPDVDFRMWGESVATGGRTSGVPTNVRLEDTYSHISSLALDDADAWLYTSAWDGVPGQLLEVAMTGIPIVGSLVGGTGEILGADDAWPVASSQAAHAYVAALREVLAGPAEARRRAAALRDRMVRERSEQAFAAQAADLLLIAADGAR
jgi:glycosyltransferase involved in cell wall biosynthesis